MNGKPTLRAPPHWTIWTASGDLTEGLFGHIVLYVLEVLPWLDRKGIQPHWELRSRLYGEGPDYVVIPGVFDAAHPTSALVSDWTPTRKNLMVLRALHGVALGPDWTELHRLWTKYFSTPARVVVAADTVPLTPRTLGLHYRGTDKATAPWDTNPVTQDDFLTLVDDYLNHHPNIDAIFIATDEASFIERAKSKFSTLLVLTTGAGAFHKPSARTSAGNTSKADHAVLDCLLLSRCAHVLNCASALSAFAKVLNPKLRIFRVAASTLFDVVPYFPIAYIPRLESADPACAAILRRQFETDWSDDRAAPLRSALHTGSVPPSARLRRLYRYLRTGLKQQLILNGFIRESERTFI